MPGAMMEPGETCRFTCSVCNKEVDITLEPKAKGAPAAEVAKLEGDTCVFCPFCGEEDSLEKD